MIYHDIFDINNCDAKVNSTIKIKNKSDTIFIIYLIQIVLFLIFIQWNLSISISY